MVEFKSKCCHLSESIKVCTAKIIYKVRKYVQDEKIFKGSAPAAPLLNSQYTASFIARLAELRYLHCMPLEKYRELLPGRWKPSQK